MPFEALCYKHIKLIKQAMNIERISAQIGTWRYAPKRGIKENGEQIDLIFDRIDRVVTLCEIKYNANPLNFDKQLATSLRNKQAVFMQQTGCNKQIFWCLITANSVARNSNLDEIILNTVVFNQLF